MTRTRAAGWTAVALLWGCEVGEVVRSARGINPCLDQLLDSLTTCSTVGMIFCTLAARIGPHAELERRQQASEAKVNTAFRIFAHTFKRAGVSASAFEDTAPIALLTAVRDKRDSA